MEKKVQLNSPFASFREAYSGQSEFDTTYKSIKILDVVKKTGEGEEDYILEKKVIVDETPIRDVIDADKDSVGVDNIIKQVLRTGDTSLLPIDKGDCNVDLVGAPESMMEVKQMGIAAEAAFKGLPSDLVGDLDMASFVNSMSQEKFDAFVNAISNRASTQSVEKKEGAGNE